MHTHMSAKWSVEELRVGTRAEGVFDLNHGNPRYRVKAHHLNGRRTPKVVVSADERIEPGVPCEVRVVGVRSPTAPANGAILVEFVRPAPFRLTGVYLDPAVARLLAVQLRRRSNILFLGPHGSGKTTAAREIARQLGYRWVSFNSAVVDTPGGWMASLVCRATPAGAAWDFVPTEIADAMAAAAAGPDERWVVFVDEFSRVDPKIANGFLCALDESRRLWCPVTNRFLEIPDNLQFILAANTGKAFTGTFRLDAAHLDRLTPIRFGYPPPAEEAALLRLRYPGVAPRDIDLVVTAAARVRSADLGDLSVRATLEACSYLADELMAGRVEDAIVAAFCPRFDGDLGDPTSDAASVRDLVLAALADSGGAR